MISSCASVATSQLHEWMCAYRSRQEGCERPIHDLGCCDGRPSAAELIWSYLVKGLGHDTRESQSGMARPQHHHHCDARLITFCGKWRARTLLRCLGKSHLASYLHLARHEIVYLRTYCLSAAAHKSKPRSSSRPDERQR